MQDGLSHSNGPIAQPGRAAVYETVRGGSNPPRPTKEKPSTNFSRVAFAFWIYDER